MSDKRPLLQLDVFLPYRINLLTQRMSYALSAIYTQDFGITISEWRVLVWLNTTPGLTAKDICDLTYMDKTKVSRIISALEKREIIQRAADKNDQRSYRLSLTASGCELIDQIIPRALDWEKAFIDSLSGEEYQNILQSIEKLENQLNQWDNNNKRGK